MIVERVRLKNGDEFPVSPAYREPTALGNMDFAVTYDGSTDTPDGAITISSANLALPMIRFTSDILAPLQLQKLSLSASGAAINTDIFLCEYDGVEWDNIMGASVNTVLSLLMSMMVGSPLSVNISGLEANAVLLDGALLCAAIAFPNSGTWTDSTLGISVTASEAGTYLVLITADATTCTIDGIATVADYVLDKRFTDGQYAKIVSTIIFYQLATAGSIDLTNYPNIAARLERAGRRMMPLLIGHTAGANLLPTVANTTSQDGIFRVIGYSWTNGAVTVGYTIATKTLTLTTT